MMRREKKTMSDELFERIAGQAAEYGIEWVNLQFYGEPLLDEKIFDRICRLKKDKIKVKFNTNASRLTNENARKLLDTGIDQVNISFDSTTKEKYNRIRVGLDYDAVVANIENFLEMKKNTPTQTLMTFVSMKQNENEVKEFKRKWKGKSDKVLIGFARNWAGQLEVQVSEKDKYLCADKNICRALWSDMVIMQDGKVALCCSDYDGLVCMGDLNYQTFGEVWNGESFVTYRRYHRIGKRRKLKLCRQCDTFSYWWV
jgi:radical SAM protein with 4Fe4S-binding SPASM domain